MIRTKSEAETRSDPAPSSSGPLVIRDLSVVYSPDMGLDGVSVEIQPGQVVGVIGPNGAGKSTLLRAIVGLVPVARGSVTLEGRPAASQRSRIAYMPQRGLVDWEFPVSVADVAMMGRHAHLGWPRWPRDRDRAVVDEALRRVGMAAYRRTPIGQLSCGQQQRVFLARALAQDADVLLLDEPMAGIDVAAQETISRLIAAERAAGKIVLMATHDLVGASCACDCLCCLNGRMVHYGPARDIGTPDVLARTYGARALPVDLPEPARRLGHAGHPTADARR